jgi:hypothetical protein
MEIPGDVMDDDNRWSAQERQDPAALNPAPESRGPPAEMRGTEPVHGVDVGRRALLRCAIAGRAGLMINGSGDQIATRSSSNAVASRSAGTVSTLSS